MHRPQLRPGLRPLWRDPSTVQLGQTPEHGAVLTGLLAGDDAVLSALDGSHDVAALHAVARTRGLPTARVGELVRALDDAGVLVDAGSARQDRVHLSRLGADRERLVPDADAWSLGYPGFVPGPRLLAERAARRVEVDGAGRLGAAVAVLLAAAGVGHVRTSDAGPVHPEDVGPGGHATADVGEPRAASLERAVRRVRGRAHRRGDALGDPPAAPHLVVLVRDDAVDVRDGDDLVRRDQAHLAVVVRDDRVVVGPLVTPGHGPCLRCLDLHRRDRDPAWPHLVAQLVAPRPGVAHRGETAIATAAAGLAGLQALTYLDGQVPPLAAGRTLDVLMPHGVLQRRRWFAHPSCGCVRVPDVVPDNGDRD